jgi:hypothetical protein
MSRFDHLFEKEILSELLSIGWLEVGVGARRAFCLGVML